MSKNLPKNLTADQQQLVKELTETHGLDASQISFEGEELNPIFDYEALSLLSLKLTDIQDIDVSIVDRSDQVVTARCIVQLSDNRTRRVEDTAHLGEILADGSRVESDRLAEHLAMSRATRRGIRAVGVNLFNAHKKFMETGEVQSGHTDHDPRYTHYQEINVLAAKLGLKKGSDRAEYEKLLAANFDGRTSAKDLDDIELQKLKTMLRSFARLSSINFADKKAA